MDVDGEKAQTTLGPLATIGDGQQQGDLEAGVRCGGHGAPNGQVPGEWGQKRTGPNEAGPLRTNSWRGCGPERGAKSNLDEGDGADSEGGSGPRCQRPGGGAQQASLGKGREAVGQPPAPAGPAPGWL